MQLSADPLGGAMTRKVLLGIALIVSLPLIVGYFGFYGLLPVRETTTGITMRTI